VLIFVNLVMMVSTSLKRPKDSVILVPMATSAQLSMTHLKSVLLVLRNLMKSNIFALNALFNATSKLLSLAAIVVRSIQNLI